MRRRTGLTGPESGQGTVEYILVLVVIIILILSFLYQFNGAFRSYAMSFFDGYISCLLETGELPGTGSSCQAEFKAYDETAAKGLLKENLPEGSGGSGKGDGKKDGAKTSGDDKKSKSGGGGGESVGGGGSGRTVVGTFGDSGRRAQMDVGKLENEKGDSGTSGDSFLGASNTVSVGRAASTNRPQSVQMQFSMGTDEQEKQEARPSAVAAGTASDPDALRGAKGVDTLGRDIAEAPKEKEGSFSIGEFVRFVIIVLIVVAMVIFFGGQLMQVARSQEKGGD